VAVLGGDVGAAAGATLISMDDDSP
jgi:hypothetical protein